jgi:23S rRNA (adenine-N6)-dimethyltransferase
MTVPSRVFVMDFLSSAGLRSPGPGNGKTVGRDTDSSPAKSGCTWRYGVLVLDRGAGYGAVTSPLAATGARVLAVERDPEFVRTLSRRFAERPNVRVVAADIRTVPLPRKDFVVVASIPYALSTVLMRRLLAPRSALRGAALIVEWGFAKRLTRLAPRGSELARWTTRYELTLIRPAPADSFSPPPRVTSALQRVRRRARPR